jgi:tetratricopeptide (TPR) repeat protein
MRAMRSKGAYYYNLRQFSHAIKAYRRALDIKPLFVNAWFTLGRAAFECEEWKEAANAFSKYTTILVNDEGSYRAWENLAIAQLKCGRLTAAMR